MPLMRLLLRLLIGASLLAPGLAGAACVVSLRWDNDPPYSMQLADGAGAMHFHNKLPQEWFDQMVVEQPRTRWAKGRAIREWVKPNGARNEAFDTSVYNLAIAYQLGLHKWSALDWRRLREKLIPPTHDLFAPALEAPQQAPTVQQPPPVQTVQTVQTSAPPPPPPLPAAIPPAQNMPVSPAATPVPQPVHIHHQPAPMGRRIRSRGI